MSVGVSAWAQRADAMHFAMFLFILETLVTINLFKPCMVWHTLLVEDDSFFYESSKKVNQASIFWIKIVMQQVMFNEVFINWTVPSQAKLKGPFTQKWTLC